MIATKRSTNKFDPSDAIAVITRYRRPRFPLERELAFSGFITWMLFPTRPDFVATGQVVCAANYFLSLGKLQRTKMAKDSPLFSQDTFAEALLNFPLGDSFSLEFESTDNETLNISELVEFFMICPDENRPSLLKALHFIEQGGFVADDVGEKEKRHFTRSATTLKKTWANYVVPSPFIWSAYSLDLEYLMKLSPDQPKTIASARKFLTRQRDITNFFGAARFCQERLISRLEKKSRSRFDFVKFPPNIDALELELPDFNPTQIALLQKYRAPKLID